MHLGGLVYQSSALVKHVMFYKSDPVTGSKHFPCEQVTYLAVEVSDCPPYFSGQ